MWCLWASAGFDSDAWEEHLQGAFERLQSQRGGYAWVNLGDGDVDWAAVRRAFAEIGYSGSVIAELDGGDEAYLRDVSKRIDQLLIGVA